MIETTTAQPKTASQRQLPGYELIERIGVGGYGEVWKATAPGGLSKAVKLVYGHVEEERAARELKSLSRLSAVNHPFLLSQERVEIVDGQLFIVMELAEASLKDRYDAYRSGGQDGVPRDELLSYMREAAEALDFLYEKHSLQHLDVKPDNILLVGDHAKIADFGLVKSIYDNNASLINGLTPKYAAPEVFSGGPTRYSDQYSLAIVYQEIVTGRLPFSGASAAELASQHVHTSPDLSPLEVRDRFAVGKALSKDPQRRFSSCREFVERLSRQDSGKIVLPTERRAENARQEQKPRGPMASPPDSRHDGRTIVVSQPECLRLSGPDVDFSDVTYRPTVFIGLGGASGEVLCQLRQLLNDRFHNITQVPAISLLHVDTDVRSINRMVAPETDGALAEQEVLLLPLESTQAYRNKHVGTLASLSRRWLYNIPRTLRTEGLRALGRLALLDHAERVLDRLRVVFSNVTDNQSLAESAEQTGLDFADYNPRVFIVSSLAGGTGSGMFIDFAYAVRQVLSEMGLDDENVCGVFTVAQKRAGSGANLATANAYASLRELQHYSSPENEYPGEPQCGLAGFRENRGPFQSSYFFEDGGKSVGDESFASAKSIAEYLYLSSVSPPSTYFDACRNAGEVGANDESTFRCFGTAKLGEDISRLPEELIAFLCQSVIRRWRGGLDADQVEPSEPSQFQRFIDDPARNDMVEHHVASVAKKKLHDVGIDGAILAGRVRGIIEERLECNADTYFQSVVSESLSNAAGQDLLSHLQSAMDVIDAIVGRGSDSASHLQSLQEAILPAVTETGSNLGSDIASWTLELVDNPMTRVEGARKAATKLEGHLGVLQEAASASGSSARSECDRFVQDVTVLLTDKKTARKKTIDDIVDFAEQYAQLQLDALVAESVSTLLGKIDGHLHLAVEELREYWSNLNRIAEHVTVVCQPQELDDEGEFAANTDNLPCLLEEAFAESKGEFIDRFDQELQDSVFNARFTLRAVLSHRIDKRDELARAMKSAARKTLISIQRDLSLARWTDKAAPITPEEAAAILRECLRRAEPELLQLGGAKRLLLISPEDLDQQLLQDTAQRLSGDEPTCVGLPNSNVWTIYEGEGISSDRILNHLVRSDPTVRELGERLHNRIDIDWQQGRIS